MKLLVTGSMLVDSSRIVVLPLLRISRSSSCLSCLISWAHIRVPGAGSYVTHGKPSVLPLRKKAEEKTRRGSVSSAGSSGSPQQLVMMFELSANSGPGDSLHPGDGVARATCFSLVVSVLICSLYDSSLWLAWHQKVKRSASWLTRRHQVVVGHVCWSLVDMQRASSYSNGLSVLVCFPSRTSLSRPCLSHQPRQHLVHHVRSQGTHLLL